MAVLDDAAALIRGRLSELDIERARLEKALKELGGTPAKRRGPRPGSKNKAGGKGKARRKRRKRSGPGRKEQVLAQIKANPGMKTSEIAKAVGIRTTQTSNLVTQLKKAGLLKGTSGKWVVSEG